MATEAKLFNTEKELEKMRDVANHNTKLKEQVGCFYFCDPQKTITSGMSVIISVTSFEPRHDKTNIMRLQPAWIQTSLRVRQSDQDSCYSLTNPITSRETDMARFNFLFHC
jgi:hypothetical protein